MKILHAKGPVILGGLVMAAALFGAASMVWFNVTVPNPVQEIEVAVRGTEASPAVPALSLVAAAAFLALSIAGRVLRWVVAAVIPLSAAAMVISVISALRDPQSATETAVGDSAGVIGANAVPDQSMWPWVALVLALLLLLIGLWTVAVVPRWSATGSNKYRRDRDSAAEQRPSETHVHDPDAARRDGIDAWDALSDGEDPTGR